VTAAAGGPGCIGWTRWRTSKGGGHSTNRAPLLPSPSEGPRCRVRWTFTAGGGVTTHGRQAGVLLAIALSLVMKGAPGKPSVLVTGVAEPTAKTQDTELETAENRDGLAQVAESLIGREAKESGWRTWTKAEYQLDQRDFWRTGGSAGVRRGSDDLQKNQAGRLRTGARAGWSSGRERGAEASAGRDTSRRATLLTTRDSALAAGGGQRRATGRLRRRERRR
jgi:hypothetical protein